MEKHMNHIMLRQMLIDYKVTFGGKTTRLIDICPKCRSTNTKWMNDLFNCMECNESWSLLERHVKSFTTYNENMEQITHYRITNQILEIQQLFDLEKKYLN